MRRGLVVLGVCGFANLLMAGECGECPAIPQPVRTSTAFTLSDLELPRGADEAAAEVFLEWGEGDWTDWDGLLIYVERVRTSTTENGSEPALRLRLQHDGGEACEASETALILAEDVVPGEKGSGISCVPDTLDPASPLVLQPLCSTREEDRFHVVLSGSQVTDSATISVDLRAVATCHGEDCSSRTVPPLRFQER